MSKTREAISVFDIFKIGVGPSSSHTMGPWRAAQQFSASLSDLEALETIRVDLFGSLAKTGKGHGTDVAVIMGLSGEDPVTCDTSNLGSLVTQVSIDECIEVCRSKCIEFHPAQNIEFHMDRALPFHPNGMMFTAIYSDGLTQSETYYSIGGGFVVQEGGVSSIQRVELPYQIEGATDLLEHCDRENCSIPEIVRRNERIWRSDRQIDDGLLAIWRTMRDCIFRGCHTGGILPGGLKVTRRASKLHAKLAGDIPPTTPENWIETLREFKCGFHDSLKWVSCFALAVNEENAAFGRVVTAPTNGAAGVIPAVLCLYVCSHEANDRDIIDFLLTAGEIGSTFKKGSTLSAAMGGCQAEIGVSSAMAAAGLCQLLGGSPGQVTMAAEIAMEHHLGLTCDPVGGLVQIPCIERNSMGAVKAITAANIALESDPENARVSLDQVIQTMWQTALDMNSKYKETSEGGLALQIPVSVPEC